MSKIVFFCIPAQGHVNPTLNVVRELVERGHEVWYYSYEPLRQKVEQAGAVFVGCEAYDAQQHIRPEQADRVGQDLALSTRLLVDTTLALDAGVLHEMERLGPDCIVADSMAVWGKAVALKLGVPFVSSTTTFAFNRHSAKIMGQGPGQLLRLLVAMPGINRDIKRLQRAGYPVKSVLDLIQNDEHTHTVVYTSPQFQPCADTFPAEYYAFVGPSVRPAQSRFEKRAERLIYLSMGTVNNRMVPLYRACIEALGDRGDQVVLSVGEQTDLSALGPLPQGVEVYPWVEQIAVLEQADLFFSHCGMNSASESLWFGVPLVLLPQTAEQQGVANRIEELGAGLPLDKPTAGAIRAAVERVLGEPSYRSRAAEIRAGFHRCPGAKGAADKILQVCK